MKSVPQPRPPTTPRSQRAQPQCSGEPEHTTRHRSGLRLRLKPKAPATGYIDGGWWPRSRDLSAELPGLANVLAVRLGRVTRVAFPIDAWGNSPRRITVDGSPVRLEGFHSQDHDVLHVTGSGGPRLSLLVIPPDTAADVAHDAMMAASGRGNNDSPAEILAAGGTAPDPAAIAPEDAQSRWDTDGGQVHEHG
jgi:hypothetical protein